MTKETVSFRIQEGLKERVDEYREVNDLSQADAYRELVRKGLEADAIEHQFEQVNERLEDLEEQESRLDELERKLETERQKGLVDYLLGR